MVRWVVEVLCTDGQWENALAICHWDGVTLNERPETFERHDEAMELYNELQRADRGLPSSDRAVYRVRPVLPATGERSA